MLVIKWFVILMILGIVIRMEKYANELFMMVVNINEVIWWWMILRIVIRMVKNNNEIFYEGHEYNNDENNERIVCNDIHENFKYDVIVSNWWWHLKI